jgi:hypothetical protein
MTVYVLLREHQNEYGYVDTSVEGVFYQQNDATRRLSEERHKARLDGLRLCDENDDGEWEVAWSIERHSLN